MPILPGDIDLLRSVPQTSRLFLVVQQPDREQGSLYGEEFLFAAQTNGVPVGDPVAAIAYDNGLPIGDTVLDCMTVLLGSTPGAWDLGILRLRGDQVTAGAGNLDIGPSSELSAIPDNSYVTVLDEFRLWTRYPRITEAAGVLTWYKDWDLLYTALGGTAADRREASLPAVPIMGPHVVRFVEDDSVWVDFDWSDSYAVYPGAAVNAWTSTGERDSGAWNSGLVNPIPVEYLPTDISGLAGYRVSLELGTDQNDPTAQYRRGIRYVFTLRKPGDRRAGDPNNAEPITDFAVTGMRGDFASGRWRASIRVFDSDASELVFLPGALVILFAEDTYPADASYIGATENGSIGPLAGRENTVLVGRIADGTIRENSETGDVSFDIISAAEQAAKRETYPVPIQDNDGAAAWYEAPDLTIFRAVWHYVLWHTNLSMIADFYDFDGDLAIPEVAANDFLASDIYSAIDSFLHARRFGRLLYDRYERGTCRVDLQMRSERSGGTLLHILDSDRLEEIQIRQVQETSTSLVELGGVVYDAGRVEPLLSNAPGAVSAYIGRPTAMRNLAIISQADINTLSGRLFAYENNEFPQVRIPMAGNWRVGDLWPQEYIVFDTLTTKRRTFTDWWTILREIEYSYTPDTGVFMVSYTTEAETDGPAGITIEIPADLPNFVAPAIPRFPPTTPPTPTYPETGGTDEGRRMIATDEGVFVTDQVGAVDPHWYASNDGFDPTVVFLRTDDDVLDIKRDPWRWWTTGGAERRLWALTRTGVWYQDDFPYGTWTHHITCTDIATATGHALCAGEFWYGEINLSIEVQDLYAFTLSYWTAASNQEMWGFVVQGAAITQSHKFNDSVGGWSSVKFAPHSAGNTIYVAENNAPGHLIDSAGRLWKSVNRGGAWALVDGPIGFAAGGQYTSISIPYIDATNPDSHVLWGRGGQIAGAVGQYRISANAAATFVTIANSDNNYTKIGGPTQERFLLLSEDSGVTATKYTIDGGMTYTNLPLLPVLMDAHAAFAIWQGATLQSVLIGGELALPATIAMYLWLDGQTVWANKTGNLAGFGMDEIREIQRDSMGVA